MNVNVADNLELGGEVELVVGRVDDFTKGKACGCCWEEMCGDGWRRCCVNQRGGAGVVV